MSIEKSKKVLAVRHWMTPFPMSYCKQEKECAMIDGAEHVLPGHLGHPNDYNRLGLPK